MRYVLMIVLLCVGPVSAQTYPEYSSTTVNDFANLMVPADEQALVAELSRLRRDTGVEMTVLTLETQSDWAPDQSLEAFATSLFNAWGIGDAARNDGVLVLVISQDRALRVELGAAYARDWDSTAERVVDEAFLPAFRSGEFSTGIRAGSAAVVRDIVMPFQEGNAPTASTSQDPGIWIFGMFAAVFAAFSMRKPIGDAMARLRVCPNCGRRGLRQTRQTTTHATTAMTGRGIRQIRCVYCDYQDESDFVIPTRSKTSVGGFGGGSSGGGGASGRW